MGNVRQYITDQVGRITRPIVHFMSYNLVIAHVHPLPTFPTYLVEVWRSPCSGGVGAFALLKVICRRPNFIGYEAPLDDVTADQT